MRNRLLLLPWLVLLASCETSQLEFMSPALHKHGLKGKTIAVCPVVCANWQQDPMIIEAALLETETLQQTSKLRPKATVLDSMQMERITGPVKSRLAGKTQPLSAQILKKAQWMSLRAKGVAMVLIPEVVENQCYQRNHRETRKETEEVRDGDGNVTSTCEREYDVIIARATRILMLRLRLVDTLTQSTVWQASMSSSDSNSIERTQNGFDDVLPPMPTTPLMDDLAAKMLAKILRRLPK